MDLDGQTHRKRFGTKDYIDGTLLFQDLGTKDFSVCHGLGYIWHLRKFRRMSSPDTKKQKEKN